MTLFNPQINGALFLDHDDVLWYESGLKSLHWDWHNAAPVDAKHRLRDAGELITQPAPRNTREAALPHSRPLNDRTVARPAAHTREVRPFCVLRRKAKHSMFKAVLGTVTLVIIACLGLPALLMSAVMSGATGACTSTTAPSADIASQPASTAQWDAEQLNIAMTIIQVGAAKGVGSWGQAIALAVGMQESGLRNLPYLGEANDHDSIGIFQQRPSQGWGTPEQLAQPAYQAGKFYDKLKAISGWQTMPLTEAAQAVQVSAYPDAYAKWTNDAIALVDRYGAGQVLLDCTGMSFGNADPAPRNPDGSWPEETCSIVPDPTTGTGCITPRTLHLVQQATAAGWPDPDCFRIDDHGEHPQGRACDFMMTAGEEASGAQKARGDAMATWVVANANQLGIKYVIWFRMIWTPEQGWYAYNNPYGGNDPYGWHTNHVHVSLV
ncbi:hypothetical protein [Actinoplanes sp. NPDC020271]|uniref:hypothetical protein n=1 Tax=Actinoplanes sp. NPDC020271 TaxID=3363896 RepID=UPI00378DE8FF